MDASALIGYAIIGTSDGFAAQTAGLLKGVDIGTIVDLDNRQIFAPAATQIIAAIRKPVDGHQYTYFVLYRYALEKERSRSGGFYGSVVALKDCTADGFAIYNLLLELATNVKVYLEPDTSRFLAGIEEIMFLPPHSLDQVIGSVKKTAQVTFRQEGYFARLSPHVRDQFRFIDHFQHHKEPVERVFASSHEDVLQLVLSKDGLPLRKIRLEDAAVEKQLQLLGRLDTEIFIREKELEGLRYQLDQLRLHQDRMVRKKKELENAIGLLTQQLTSMQQQSPQNNLERENQAMENETSPAGNRPFMSSLYPVVRLTVLVFGVFGIAFLGYFTTTAFGQKNKTELVQPARSLTSAEAVLKLEQQLDEHQSRLDLLAVKGFVDRLQPIINSPDTLVRRKAERMQQQLLQSSYRYYQRELERTDSIPVLHSQLEGEFQIFKQEYDSLFNFDAVK